MEVWSSDAGNYGASSSSGGVQMASSHMLGPRPTSSVSVTLEAPPVIRVVGRPPNRENGDLTGEYRKIGMFHGRPAYRKPGTRTVIRYWSPVERWLIDREGLQESDVCNAYTEQSNVSHPTDEDLVWRIWETASRRHVADPEFLVTVAPKAVQVMGRANGKENSALNGEYTLMGLHQGRVAYRKLNTKHVIRYWATGDRWLIDLNGLRDVDVCNAYADARGASHPGDPALCWHVWDTQRGRHIADACLQSLVAPRVIELIGREAPKENTSLNGSFHLVGLHEGRPAYQKQEGARAAIRYWPREDRWLVDLEGLRDVDLCNAYAEAQGGAEHPGFPSLQWYIWETSRGKHLLDQHVRALVCPHIVCISGRDAYKENYGVNGEYFLVGLIEGLPAYRKPGSTHAIRYWSREDRWLIDLDGGLRGADIANAFADAHGAEHPGNPALVWHLWETSRGRHIADEEIIADAVNPLEGSTLLPSHVDDLPFQGATARPPAGSMGDSKSYSSPTESTYTYSHPSATVGGARYPIPFAQDGYASAGSSLVTPERPLSHGGG